MGLLETFLLWFLDRLRGWQQNRRKVRVLVHAAFFQGSRIPYYFVNVTNLSRDRDVEVTHVWFDVQPPLPLVLSQRPLPIRLRPDESWETWVEAGKLVNSTNPETLARVRLSTSQIVKSRANREVLVPGFVPGPR